MKRIVFNSKKCVCIGLAAVALQAYAVDNERAICSDLSLGTSEKVADANGLLADSSRVYDIDEVVVVSQPKENFRLRQQALSTLPLVLIRCSDWVLAICANFPAMFLTS